MTDFFFQIVLFLLGIIFGIITPLLKPVQQKRTAGTLSVILIMVGLLWGGYELGTRQKQLDSTAIQTVDVPEPTHQNSSASKTIPIPILQISATPIISSTPSQTETPQPLPTLTSVPTITVTDSPILFQSDWSTGHNGWFGSSDWKTVNGMLVSDGTNGSYLLSITAPVIVNTDDYAVEAEIQVVRALDCSSFGLVARISENEEGYQGGINYCEFDGPVIRQMQFDLGHKEFHPGSEWHKYRLEVRGNNISFFIDGVLALVGSDNRYLSGRQVGLWSDEVQLNIRYFIVTRLDQ